MTEAQGAEVLTALGTIQQQLTDAAAQNVLLLEGVRWCFLVLCVLVFFAAMTGLFIAYTRR